MESRPRNALDKSAFAMGLATLMVGRTQAAEAPGSTPAAARAPDRAPPLCIGDALLRAQGRAFVGLFQAYWRRLQREGRLDDGEPLKFLVSGLFWVAVEKGAAPIRPETLERFWRLGSPAADATRCRAAPPKVVEALDHLALTAAIERFRAALARHGVDIPLDFEDLLYGACGQHTNWFSRSRTIFQGFLRRDPQLATAWTSWGRPTIAVLAS